MAPGSLCYVTLEGKPFSNADIDDEIVYHQATLIGIVPHPQLQNGSILKSFNQALQNIGYAGYYLQFPYLQSIRESIEDNTRKSKIK